MKDQTPERKLSQKACLFVAQIARDADEESLREHFAPYGEVLSVKILRDRTPNRPYAFVQYQEEEEAALALEKTAESTLHGRKIRVEKARVNCTLFVAKLSKTLTNTELREMFEEFGAVESVSIIKNHHTQKSKGCGFVKFYDREHAQTAFHEMKNNTKGLVVEWATSKNDPEALGVDKCNIFVGGLHPHHVEEGILRDRFGAYGTLDSVTLVNRHAHEETEETKGPREGPQRSAFAFLRYTTPEASASAIESENGSEWFERKIRVQYCESQETKNKRRAAKGQGYYGAPGYFPGNPSGLFYPPMAPPNQNGMVMMGGMAWYPLPYPGMDPATVNGGAMYGSMPPYGSYAPYSPAPWSFTPSYTPTSSMYGEYHPEVADSSVPPTDL